MNDTMAVIGNDYSYGDVTIAERAIEDLIACSAIEFGLKEVKVVSRSKDHYDYQIVASLPLVEAERLYRYVRDQFDLLLGQVDVTLTIIATN
nr:MULTISPECIES: hypothetical protein [unclassified Exiguobacterium]